MNAFLKSLSGEDLQCPYYLKVCSVKYHENGRHKSHLIPLRRGWILPYKKPPAGGASGREMVTVIPY
jgi:hypothetical protein